MYCLAHLAIRLEDSSAPPPARDPVTGVLDRSNYLQFDGHWYRFFDTIADPVKLMRNIGRCDTLFSLHPTTQHFDSQPQLSLFVEAHNLPNDEPHLVLQMMQRFFNIAAGHYEYADNMDTQAANNDASSSSSITADTIQHIYAKLREHHAQEAFEIAVVISAANQGNLCPSLNPELRSYQLNAVNWMIDREHRDQYLPSDLVSVTAKVGDHSGIPKLFYDRRTGALSSEPVPVRVPRGGILADEMGLGKTVEILALILCNRSQTIWPAAIGPLPNADPGVPADILDCDPMKLWCICGGKTRKHASQPDRRLLQCRDCGNFQHIRCMSYKSGDSLIQPESAANYMCPECWQTGARSRQPLIESGATFIVSPASIRLQWLQELQRHVRDVRVNELSAPREADADGATPAFHVLVYEGVKRGGWISPAVLAGYDVVLADYAALAEELHFLSSNRRQALAATANSRAGRRGRPRYMPIRTPLLRVNWWRVCLDEAQQVDTPVTLSAQMVKLLPTVNRWSVTGTPIEKSIDNLYGLVYFLGCRPFDEPEVWARLTAIHHGGLQQPLIDALQPIMWRTCKTSVWETLDIPSQSVVVHRVKMNDLQAFYYQGQHQACAQRFREKVAKLGGSGGAQSQQTVGRMAAKTLAAVMDPLRQLRQDCSVPSLVMGAAGRGGAAAAAAAAGALLADTEHEQADVAVAAEVTGGLRRRMLSPAELHAQLISNHMHEGKSQLRSIVVGSNGLAALHAIRREFSQAMDQYEKVLRLAREHTGTIAVDSLLQLHTIHNLLDMYEMQGCPENAPPDLRNQLRSMQIKYMSNCRELVAKHGEQVHKANEHIDELGRQLENPDGAFGWWQKVIGEHMSKRDMQTFNDRVNADMAMSYIKVGVRSFSSECRLISALHTWQQQVTNERHHIRDAFENLQFFIDNVRAYNPTPTDVDYQMKNFIRVAMSCHLDAELPPNFVELFFNEMTDDIAQRISAGMMHGRVQCDICRVRKILNEYECVIFDKEMAEDSKETIGSWNPSWQERILKSLFMVHKNSANPNAELLQHAEFHLTVLEATKAEYKAYSRYWVELNYALSAIDELNMCKERLRLVPHYQNPGASTTMRARIYIAEEQVDFNRADLLSQVAQAEDAFVRSQGTIKYLSHLRRDGRSPLEMCPICKLVPGERYAVLQCGHHFCFVCMLGLAHHSRAEGSRGITCAVCRNQQNFRNVYFVNDVVAPKPATGPKNVVLGEHSPKVTEIVRVVIGLRHAQADVKVLIFSQWDSILGVVADALVANSIEVRKQSTPFHRCVAQFKDPAAGVSCLLLPLSCGAKGLNLIEATHVFLVEPILDPSVELQAIGRVHRIGQTKPTTVHRFIVEKTIEETIFNTISNDDSGRWRSKDVTIAQLEQLFNDADL